MKIYLAEAENGMHPTDSFMMSQTEPLVTLPNRSGKYELLDGTPINAWMHTIRPKFLEYEKEMMGLPPETGKSLWPVTLVSPLFGNEDDSVNVLLESSGIGSGITSLDQKVLVDLGARIVTRFRRKDTYVDLFYRPDWGIDMLREEDGEVKVLASLSWRELQYAGPILLIAADHKRLMDIRGPRDPMYYI